MSKPPRWARELDLEKNLILADSDIILNFKSPGYESIINYIVSLNSSCLHVIFIWPFVNKSEQGPLFDRLLKTRSDERVNIKWSNKKGYTEYQPETNAVTRVFLHIVANQAELEVALRGELELRTSSRISISIPKHVSVSTPVIKSMFEELLTCPELGHFYDPVYLYHTQDRSTLLDLSAFIHYMTRLSNSPYYNIADPGLHILCVKPGYYPSTFVPLDMLLPGESAATLPTTCLKMKPWLASLRQEPPINWQFQNWTFMTPEKSTQWVAAHYTLGITKREFTLAFVKWLFIIIILCAFFYANFSAMCSFYLLIIIIQFARYFVSFLWAGRRARTHYKSIPYYCAKKTLPDRAWREERGNVGPRTMRYAVVSENYDWAIFCIVSKLIWPFLEILFLWSILIILLRTRIRTLHKSRIHYTAKRDRLNAGNLNLNLAFENDE